MNRTVMAGVTLAALGLAVSPQARAQAQQQTGEMQKEMPQQTKQLRAVRVTVTDVDQANHKVTFEAKVSPEASFKSGQGQPIKIDQLRKGDEVRAAFDPKTGEVVAVQVVRPSKSAGGTTTPSK
jgi:hypothetical protein